MKKKPDKKCLSLETGVVQVRKGIYWNKSDINQRITVIISINTLQYLLGETEPAWTCPECHDVSS